MGRIYRIFRPSWAPVRFSLWLASRFFSWFFTALPLFVMRSIPHSTSILSVGFLYVFAQALGILWLLHINLFSNCSVRLVEYIQRYLEGETPGINTTMQRVLSGYVLYCLLRILFFIGTSLYTIGWEAFSDFPTVRRLVAGRSSDRNERSEQVDKLAAARVLTPTGRHSQKPRSLTRLLSEDWLTDDVVHAPSEDDFNRQHSEPSTTDGEHRESPPRENIYGTRESNGESQSGPPHEAWGGPKTGPVRRRRNRRFRREATLLAPLLGLMACTMLLCALTVTCHLQVLSCENSDFASAIANPTGRLNRGIRFALFIALLQWQQQFVYLFPRWHRGLLATRMGQAWSLVAMPLFPVSFARLALWSVMPAGTGNTQLLVGSLPHHAVDTALIVAMKGWMVGTCLLVLQRPECSGMTWTRLSDDAHWHEMAALFKYSFLLPIILHFMRGVAKFGFAGAQIDLLVIVCAYPLLLTAVWTVVWAVVVAPGKRQLLAGIAGSSGLASVVCLHAGSHQAAAITVVWLHLMRQFLKLFGKQTTQSRYAAVKRGGAAAQLTSHAKPAAHLPTETWGKLFLGFWSVFAVTFFGVLVGLAAVSNIQQKIDWYPTTIWFEREESPPGLRVDHLISRLRLQLHPSGAELNESVTFGGTDGVSYAVCGHNWHGLSILDYGLLSLASYFDRSDPSLLDLLDGIFPAQTGIRWHLREAAAPRSHPGTGSRLSWIEVEISKSGMELPLLVVAVRGTDPIRVSDYVEDIRMWTEPVALSILSTIFPTVRAWPRRTAEVVITGIHDFMDALGMTADKWSYSELVESLSQIPKNQYSRVVLTGHSLGGGMATVVATLTHLPVIGITPPGIYWSIAKHHRNASDGSGRQQPKSLGSDQTSWMHHESLTLKVENDWVNGVFDDHGGLVQMMTCDRSEESLQLACHMLEGTICHIFRRCGDPLRRWKNCAHEYVLTGQMHSTAAKVIRQALPHELVRTLDELFNWVQRLTLPGWHGTSGNFALLVLALALLLPIVGGAIEDLFLL